MTALRPVHMGHFPPLACRARNRAEHSNLFLQQGVVAHVEMSSIVTGHMLSDSATRLRIYRAIGLSEDARLKYFLISNSYTIRSLRPTDMRDLLIIFVVLLVLLIIISTMGGSVRHLAPTPYIHPANRLEKNMRHKSAATRGGGLSDDEEGFEDEEDMDDMDDKEGFEDDVPDPDEDDKEGFKDGDDDDEEEDEEDDVQKEGYKDMDMNMDMEDDEGMDAVDGPDLEGFDHHGSDKKKGSGKKGGTVGNKAGKGQKKKETFVEDDDDAMDIGNMDDPDMGGSGGVESFRNGKMKKKSAKPTETTNSDSDMGQVEGFNQSDVNGMASW